MEKLTFNDKFKRLEYIVKELEKNDIDLDQVLSLYKEANVLSKDLTNQLSDALKYIEENNHE